MYLSKLEVNQFRNYKKEIIKLCDKTNIFIGNNAQGKTNIIESIYILALTKSHRLGFENNIIKDGYQSGGVKGFLRNNSKLLELEVKFLLDSKKVFVNNKEIKKISSYISNMNVIMFSPTDLDIINGSPQVRRNLLNTQISQLYPMYVTYLNEYNKILKTRNEYLKQMSINGLTDNRYLDIINEKLVDRAVLIFKYRKQYLDQVNNRIGNIYKNIMNINGLNILYENSLELDKFDEEIIKNKFYHKLKTNFKRELSQGMTLYGPHRDDFSFYIDKQNMKFYASQGQKRLAIIAFKLSEVQIFIDEKNDSPILLLDDIFSELDIEKRNALIKYIPDNIQTIITTTDLKNINKKIIKNSKIFVVDHGTINEKAG